MTFDPDAPWWLNILLLLVVGTVPAVVAWLTSRHTRRDVSGIHDQVAGIHNQVTNEHTENFRDEVTKGFTDVISRLDAQDKRTDMVARSLSALNKRLTTHIDSGG